MGWFEQLLGGGQRGGYSAAEDAYKQQMQKAMGGYSPYLQAGTGALGQYQQSLAGMADPSAYYSNLMGGYQTSPGAQFQQEQMQKQIHNQMARRGLAGSGAETKSLMKYGQGLIGQDQQQYLHNLLGIGGQYRSGLQGLTGLGSQMQGQYGQMGQNYAQNLGQLEYGRERSKGAGWRNLLGIGLSALGFPGTQGGQHDVGGGKTSGTNWAGLTSLAKMFG